MGFAVSSAMIYNAYQNFADVSHSLRALAASSPLLFDMSRNAGVHAPLRYLTAWHELIALVGFTHNRPDYGIDHVESAAGAPVPVEERPALTTPFCTLRHFRRADATDDPKVLLVSPMSGHFATLLRGTIRTLLRDNEVYVTDWGNPRDIPLSDGVFGFDDFVQHLIDFLRFLGPQTHVVAVCQPAVQSLVATSILAEDGDACQPASLTLMAGPIDTRINPTKVNEFATSKNIDWFRSNMVGTVPASLKGAGRRVYPGFVQVSAFMSMNAERHAKAFADFFHSRIDGDREKAEQIKTFYQEYFAIMDLDAAFYLQTIENVFQSWALPQGRMMFKGRRVEPRAIRKTFLLTVEGERDDICSVGQTLAAQDLCSGLRPYMKSHYMQAGVGHYGVFNGRKWDGQIYPVVRNHIHSSI